MDDDSRTSLLVIVILLGLAAVFALTETALSSVSRNKIKAASDKGDPRAVNALYALDRFDDAITTLLICTNIVHICTASLVTLLVTRRWGLSAVSLSTVITTIVVFFIGEMVPKSIGKKNSYSCILASAGFLKVCMIIMKPFSKILSGVAAFAGRLTGDEAEITVTEDELYDIIEDMEEEGSIDEEQGELFSSALQFSDVMVDSILTPRVDMAAIDIQDDPEEIREFIRESNHSRLPVYEGTPDHIIGVLQIRKYMKACLRGDGCPELKGLLDEVFYVHQGAGIDEVFELMSQRRISIAVVTDPYGGTLGIVTIEDILEELVGEIWDEDDLVREPIREMGEGVWMIDATETVEDALESIGTEPDPEDEEGFTNLLLSEWAYDMFPEIPLPGASFTYKNIRVTVEEMERNRILLLKMELIPEEGGGSDE